jgi:hypothetical protein
MTVWIERRFIATVIPRPGRAAVCSPHDWLQGRGIYCRIGWGRTRQPLHRFGCSTAGQGQCGASRQATRKRRVDFSVARRVCRKARFCAALHRNDSLDRKKVHSDCHSEARPRSRLLLARLVAGPRNLLSDRMGPDAAAAPHVRVLNRRTGPVWGVAAGHEETESRFLSRAPGWSQRHGSARRSIEMTVWIERRFIATVIPRPGRATVCSSHDWLQGSGNVLITPRRRESG